jgi:hypothetical protein
MIKLHQARIGQVVIAHGFDKLLHISGFKYLNKHHHFSVNAGLDPIIVCQYFNENGQCVKRDFFAYQLDLVDY